MKKLLTFLILLFAGALSAQNTSPTTVVIGVSTQTGRTMKINHIWADSTYLNSFGMKLVSPNASITASGIIWTGTAGDVTSPGKTYYLTAANTWSRADTNVEITAEAIMIDSVASGVSCRLLLWGLFFDADKTWTAGGRVFSDSAASGVMSQPVVLQAVPKKMQYLGKALTTKIMLFNPDGTIDN